MTVRTILAAGFLLGFVHPAMAQQHSSHAMHSPPPADAAGECEAEAERHRAMGHPVPEGECAPLDHAGMTHHEMDHGEMSESDADHTAMDHGGMDHGTMNHAEMGHHQMGHDLMNHEQMDHGSTGDPVAPARIPTLPSPPAAGSGPARAADAIWGAEAMRASREALRRGQGGQTFASLLAERFEYRVIEGSEAFLWDIHAWYGGDTDRIWLETEGEGHFADGVEEADIALLYGRAISPWFDLRAGVRQDLTGPERTYLDLGIQGLAPYLFEVEADLYLSGAGDVTASAEVELDQRITQRLILQPRAEIALAAQDVPELGIGAGIDTIGLGLRLRYEILRELAPYIGVEQEWRLGGSADYARAAGEEATTTAFVMGTRFWF